MLFSKPRFTENDLLKYTERIAHLIIARMGDNMSKGDFEANILHELGMFLERYGKKK